MLPPGLLSLVVLNIFLPLITSYLFLRSRELRNTKENIYFVLSLLLWSCRYLWMLGIWSGMSSDLANRAVAVVLVLLIFFPLLWLKEVFPSTSDSGVTNLTELLHWITFFVLITSIPFAILLPPDMQVNDANYDFRIFLLLISIIFVVVVVLRIIRHLRGLRQFSYYRWYYLGFFSGIVMIISDVTIFTYIIPDTVLKLMSPVFGFFIIIGTLIIFKVFPLVQFAMMVNTGVIIVQIKNEKVEFMNETAKNFVKSEFKSSNPQLNTLWPSSYQTIYTAYETAKTEMRTVQVEERLVNYKTGEIQNLQLTFYPYGSLSSFERVGILISNSDEIEFLKQRKEFLLDILNHDIANVSQTLQFSLESLQKKSFTDIDAWETIDLVKKQNEKLEQLVFSAQNILYVDSIIEHPNEVYTDFGDRLELLIKEERRKYPEVKINFTDLTDLKTIRTTGNLRAGFALALRSVFEAVSQTDNEVEVSTKIFETRHQQEISFRFNSDIITSNLMESYSRKQKSDIVSSSSIRINLLVAAAIVQKNQGQFTIQEIINDIFSTEIIICLPILKQG